MLELGHSTRSHSVDCRVAAADSTSHDDLGLIRALRSGCAKAADRFVLRLHCIPRFLHSIARRHRIRLERDQVQDLTQEVVVRLWERVDEYEGRSCLESWIFSFCRNALRDLARVRPSRPIDAIEEPRIEPNDEAVPWDERALLYAALEQLAEDCGRIVRLRHFEGLGFERIARDLNLPAGTVKSRYYRGLDRLRVLLRPAYE